MLESSLPLIGVAATPSDGPPFLVKRWPLPGGMLSTLTRHVLGEPQPEPRPLRAIGASWSSEPVARTGDDLPHMTERELARHRANFEAASSAEHLSSLIDPGSRRRPNPLHHKARAAEHAAEADVHTFLSEMGLINTRRIGRFIRDIDHNLKHVEQGDPRREGWARQRQAALQEMRSNVEAATRHQEQAAASEERADRSAYDAVQAENSNRASRGFRGFRAPWASATSTWRG